MGTFPTRICPECGEAFQAARNYRNRQRLDLDRQFCRKKCQVAFGNRQTRRGAQLYPLFMAMRFERSAAAQAGLWKDICRLGEAFREEDRRERDGRQSWSPFSAVVERLTDAGLISRQVTATEAREFDDRRRASQMAARAHV